MEEVIETKTECIDLEEGEDEIWDELASASVGGSALGVEPVHGPDNGLTELETWLWYSDPSQVGRDRGDLGRTGHRDWMEMIAMVFASTSWSSRAVRSRSCSTSRAASRSG
jgi:hypothetical protein